MLCGVAVLNQIILVGTSHSIQRDKSRSDFSDYIKGLIEKYNIGAIAEEIDDQSVVADLSTKLGVFYRNIEPTPEERKALGISSLNEIDCSIFMEFDDPNSQSAQTESKVRKEKVYARRESEWLARVKNINSFPILVICGANHFQSFGDLLKKNGFQVMDECKLWK